MYLLWYKNNGKFAKQLREELLEVLNHAYTVKETKESEFHRRTSLKLVQREVEFIYMGMELLQVILSQG